MIKFVCPKCGYFLDKPDEDKNAEYTCPICWKNMSPEINLPSDCVRAALDKGEDNGKT